MNLLKKFSCEIIYRLTMDDICYEYQDANGKWHYGMQAEPSEENLRNYHTLPEYIGGIDFQDDINISDVTLSTEIKGDLIDKFDDSGSFCLKKDLLQFFYNESNKETIAQKFYNEIKNKFYSNNNLKEHEVTGLKRIVLFKGIPFPSKYGINLDVFYPLNELYSSNRNKKPENFNWLELSYEIINGKNKFVLYPRIDVSLFGPLNSHEEIQNAKKNFSAYIKNQILNMRSGNYTTDEYGFNIYENEEYDFIQNSEYVQNFDFFKNYRTKLLFFVNITLKEDAYKNNSNIGLNRHTTLNFYDEKNNENYFIKVFTPEAPITFRDLIKKFKEKYPDIFIKPEIPGVITQNFIDFGNYEINEYDAISNYKRKILTIYDFYDGFINANNEKNNNEKLEEILENPTPVLIYDEETGEMEINPEKYNPYSKDILDLIMFNKDIRIKSSNLKLKDFNDFQQRKYCVFKTYCPPTFTVLTESDKQWYTHPSGQPFYTKDSEGNYVKFPTGLSWDDPENTYKPGVTYYRASFIIKSASLNSPRKNFNILNDEKDDYIDFDFYNINDNEIKTFKDLEKNKLYSAIGIVKPNKNITDPPIKGFLTLSDIDSENFNFYSFSDKIDDIKETNFSIDLIYKENDKKFSYKKHLKIKLMFNNFQDTNGKWHYGIKQSSQNIAHFIIDPFEDYYNKDYIKSITLANDFLPDKNDSQENTNNFYNWWDGDGNPGVKNNTIYTSGENSGFGYPDLANDIKFTTPEDGEGLNEIAIIPEYQITSSNNRPIRKTQHQSGIDIFEKRGYLTLKFEVLDNTAGFYLNVKPYSDENAPLRDSFILNLSTDSYVDENITGFDTEEELEEYKTRIYKSTNIHDQNNLQSGEYLSYENSWFYINFIINVELYGPAEKDCDFNDLTSKVLTIHTPDGKICKASADITNGPVKIKDLINEIKNKNNDVINYERLKFLNADKFSNDPYIIVAKGDTFMYDIPVLDNDIEEQTLFNKNIDLYWNDRYEENKFTLHIHKNDNSDPEVVWEYNYKDYNNTPDDTLDTVVLISRIPNEMKVREKDDHYIYNFKGISTSSDGEAFEVGSTIENNADLFILWHIIPRKKVPVIIHFHDGYTEEEHIYTTECYTDETTELREALETLPSRFTSRNEDTDNRYNFLEIVTDPHRGVAVNDETRIQNFYNDGNDRIEFDLFSTWETIPREYEVLHLRVLKDAESEEYEDIEYRVYSDEDFDGPVPSIIEDMLSQSFKERPPEGDKYYTFTGVVVEKNYETDEYEVHAEWEEHERTSNTFTVTVHGETTYDENGNPIELFIPFEFKDYDDTVDDDVTIAKIIEQLPNNYTEKAKDNEYSYTFAGLYNDTETQEVLDGSTRITNDIDLYVKWTVTPRPKINFVIETYDNYSDENPNLFTGQLFTDVEEVKLTPQNVIDQLPSTIRAKDADFTYEFMGLSTDSDAETVINNDENLITDTSKDFNLTLYCIWNAIPRPYEMVNVKVYKDENSEEYEEVSYRNYEDETNDDKPTSEKLESLLSSEFKQRPSDENNYSFDRVHIEFYEDGTYKAYAVWSAFPRPYKNVSVTIMKNDGTNAEPFVYTFKDVTDTSDDNKTIQDIINAIPEEFKTRAKDENNYYTFIGLAGHPASTEPFTSDLEITEDTTLYAIWETSDRPFKIIHVNVHKNDGTDYSKVFEYRDIIDKDDDNITIENILSELEDDLTKREKDANLSYVFAGISDVPDGEVIDTLTPITDDIDLYLIWTSKERPFKNIRVTVHKNNGSQVTTVVEYKDMTDESTDDLTIAKIIERLSEDFKTREPSDEFTYTFAGLNSESTGVCLSEATVISEDCNLYAVWNIEDRLFNPIKVVVYKNDNTSSSITLNYKDIIDIDKDDLYLNTVLNDLPYDFKERSRTATHSYEFAGIAETPDGEILDPDKFAIPADKNFYLKWTEHVREFNEIKIIIHKNDGTDETRELEFKDMLDDDFDDVYLSLINERLSDEFKNRPSDSEWLYEFGGLSLTADGEAITDFENRFTNNMELYIVWNKTDINLVRDVIEYKKVIKIRPHDILRKFQDSEGKWCYGIVTIQQFDTVDQFDYLNDERITNINLKTTPDGNLSKIINLSDTLSHLPDYLNSTLFRNVQVKIKSYENTNTFEILIPENINIFENGFETEEELDAAIAKAGITDNNAPMYSLFYVNVERTKGENPETLKVTLHKNDGSSIIEEVNANVSNGPVSIKSILDSFLENYPDFIKRDSTDLFSYTFNNYALDINNSKSLTDFELENRMVYTNPLTLYCIWNEHDRTYSDIDLLVHKNDGSAEYEKISFRELDDTDIDDVDYIMVQDRLSESLKTRNHDDIYLYHFAGISESPNGEIINSTEYKFKESKNLYIIWEKEKLIPEDPDETPDNKDEFVKAGDLKLIEDTLFIIPEDIGNIEKIEYCNDYYYVLCDNNKVYKISVQDNVAKIENILDLSGYNADPSDTDIIACENVLIIKAGDYILTDKETIKSNFGISESSLSFKIDDTIKTLNTKTIAIINGK